MDTILFMLGIACIIAAVVGGGFKAAGFEFPILSSTPRQIALAVLGIILIIVSPTFGPRPSPGPQPTPIPPQYLEIDYNQRGGNFIIIGPNPDGVFAQQGYWWKEIDIAIENKCADRVYIEPGYFRLYLSSQPSTENAKAYSPTTQGLQYQPNRIASGWLESGKKTSGRLIFEVQLTQDEEAGRAAQYSILRYYSQTSCSIRYKPY